MNEFSQAHYNNNLEPEKVIIYNEELSKKWKYEADKNKSINEPSEKS